MVAVLRNAENMGFAEIEKQITIWLRKLEATGYPCRKCLAVHSL